MKIHHNARTALLLILLGSVVIGCTSLDLPDDGGTKWFDSIRLALGSSFNLWKIQNEAVPAYEIPLVYPLSWSKDKWQQAYIDYAHRYRETRHINYLFELRNGKWTPRTETVLGEKIWSKRFSGNSDIKWLSTVKADLPIDGSVKGHYLPILHYRAPFTLYETYLVIFEMDDQIIGYVRWAYKGGEVKYIQKHFGFIP